MADAKITALTAATAPADADIIPIVQDVATTPVTKKVTWTVLKAFLKTYFDTIYQAAGGGTVKTIIPITTTIGCPANSTGYSGLSGGFSGSDDNSKMPFPIAGNIIKFSLYQYETLNGTAGQTVVHTLRKNGVDTAAVLTFTVGDTAQVKTYTGSIAVAAGDVINIKSVSGSITAYTGRISLGTVEFDPT